MFAEIPASSSWSSVAKVQKGWSSDEKYQIVTEKGEKLLLRLSDISNQAEKRAEFEIISKFASLGFEMSKPLDFGVCGGGEKVYMLLTWVDGRDLEITLPTLPVTEQYRLGRKAGMILRSIHNLPLEPKDLPQKTKLEKKLRQLNKYLGSALRIENDQPALDFFYQNTGLIWKQPPAYLHGDYHPGNMILTLEDGLGVIDFNRWEIGDPYEEFYKLESFGTEASIPYCIGQIDAYFDDHVPDEFWRTMAVYVAHASLYSIVWAEKFGQKDIDEMVSRCKRTFDNYENFSRIVPKWYTQNVLK